MEVQRDSSGVIGALIRSIVRLCLRRGIRSSQIEEAIRQNFVREAEEEIKRANGELSVSKLSIMTGLHRSEVSRLMAGKVVDSKDHDLLTRIIGLWSTSKRYRDVESNVRDLSFEGLSSDFAKLVASVSKEVTHYPILFELERLGAIEYHGDLVRLVARAYVPHSEDGHAFEILSRDISDLAASVETNVQRRFSTPCLHLRTEFDNIPPYKLDEIKAFINKKGTEFQDAIREYLSSFDRDVTNCNNEVISEKLEDQDRARVTFTTFSYAEPIEKIRSITPKKRGRKKNVS